MDNIEKIVGKVVDIAPEIYSDGLKSTVEKSGQVLELVPRAIRAALSPLEKWILHKEYSLEETEKLLQAKLENVKPENINTPEPYVAVPALQAISYCMDSVELRTMFANLLANSMNSTTKEKVHPAFVDIIKQLSPIDAKMLAEFRPKTPLRIGTSVSMKKYIEKDGRRIRVDSNDNEIEDLDETPPPITDDNSQLIGYEFPKIVKPLVSYLIADKTSHNATLLQDNVVKTQASTDISLISASIANLTRLGLIELDYSITASIKDVGDDIYKCFLEKPLLPNWQELSVHPLLRAIQVKGLPANYDTVSETKKLELRKGVAQLTQFGFNFISSCVIEAEFLKADNG